jgi:hypothetical protein
MKKALVYILTFIAIQLVAQFLVVSVYALVTGEGADADLPALWLIGTMVLFSVVTLVVFISMKWFSASPTYLRSRPWGVVAWSVVAALGAIIPSLTLQSYLPELSGWAKELADSTDEQLSAIMSVPGGYMVVALLPPLVEEMVMRGCVLRSLLQWQPRLRWPMIVLSALFFALIHLNPAQMPHAFLIGLLLGWMYERTGSIVPGVVYHWANNSAAYAMFHIYHNPQTLQDIIGPGTRPMLMALFFSLLILLPALVQLNMRMKRTGHDTLSKEPQ